MHKKLIEIGNKNAWKWTLVKQNFVRHFFWQMGVTRIWSQCKSFMTISKTIRQIVFQISIFKKISECLKKKKMFNSWNQDIRCKMIIHMGKCTTYILEILLKSSIFDFIFLYLILKNCQKSLCTINSQFLDIFYGCSKIKSKTWWT